MMSNANMVEQGQNKRDHDGNGNKEKLILLLLRKDLRKIYMKALVDRLHDSDVTVAVDETNYPEEKQKKFHWILSYPGDIPKGKTPDASSFGLIFRVPGMPKLQVEKLPPSDSVKQKKLIRRYKEVQQTSIDRVKHPAFVKLALIDAVLRGKQQLIQKFENLENRLEQKISLVEKPYYKGIGFILSTSIEKITGIAVLDGLMKGLVHVMIIDDMEKRTIDGLVSLDFKRKFLSFMSTSELSKKIQEFRKVHAEDEFAKANIEEFIFNSPDFEHIEIVFFNSWKFTEDSFPIRVALRKKAIISKKEERKVKQEDQVVGKIATEEKALVVVKLKLEEVIRVINKMEKSHFDDEDEYQLQTSARKRFIKDIKIRELRLKEMKRPVSKGSGEEKIITIDLFDIFKNKQSFMDRMSDKAGSLGLGDLWGKHVKTDDSFSFNKLAEMARFSKDWIKASAQLKKIKSQTTHLAKQLKMFVETNELTTSVSSSGSGAKVNYQPLLDEHILDRLELAVLSCEISNLCEDQDKK
jgi:hypothetical protein